MCVVERSRRAKMMLRGGLVCLVLGNMGRLFVHPQSDFAKGFFEGIEGALIGVSLVFMLSYTIKYARRKSQPGPGSCA